MWMASRGWELIRTFLKQKRYFFIKQLPKPTKEFWNRSENLRNRKIMDFYIEASRIYTTFLCFFSKWKNLDKNQKNMKIREFPYFPLVNHTWFTKAHWGVHHSQHKVSFIVVISKSRPSCYKPSFSHLRRTLGECFLTVGLSIGRSFLTLRNRFEERGSAGSCSRKPTSTSVVFCFQSFESFRTTVENNWDAQQTAAMTITEFRSWCGSYIDSIFKFRSPNRSLLPKSDWIPKHWRSHLYEFGTGNLFEKHRMDCGKVLCSGLSSCFLNWHRKESTEQSTALFPKKILWSDASPKQDWQSTMIQSWADGLPNPSGGISPMISNVIWRILEPVQLKPRNE